MFCKKYISTLYSHIQVLTLFLYHVEDKSWAGDDLRGRNIYELYQILQTPGIYIHRRHGIFNKVTSLSFGIQIESRLIGFFLYAGNLVESTWHLDSTFVNRHFSPW